MEKQLCKCYVCGKEFKRYIGSIKNPDMICCSFACRDIMYIDRYKGKNNPNWRNKFIGNSFCHCGNPKDYRAKQCSSCARVGFAKEGAKTIFDIDENSLKDIIQNSLSIYEVAKFIKVSRKVITRLVTKYNIDISHFVPNGKAKRYLMPNTVLIENSEFGNDDAIRCIKRNNLLEYKCNICGLKPLWMGKKLTIQLHHKNGNRRDHRLENLEFECPNCHSQTINYKGRKSKGKSKVKNV
jgi:transposase